jgi:hypothetical protein
MNDPAGCGFPWMKPPLDIDDPLLLPLWVVEICDSKHGDIYPTKGLAEDLVLEVATTPARRLRAVRVVRVETFLLLELLKEKLFLPLMLQGIPLLLSYGLDVLGEHGVRIGYGICEP